MRAGAVDCINHRITNAGARNGAQGETKAKE